MLILVSFISVKGVLSLSPNINVEEGNISNNNWSNVSLSVLYLFIYRIYM